MELESGFHESCNTLLMKYELNSRKRPPSYTHECSGDQCDEEEMNECNAAMILLAAIHSAVVLLIVYHMDYRCFYSQRRRVITTSGGLFAYLPYLLEITVLLIVHIILRGVTK
uniref:Uncharacterized protein n=1 Tax=Glossina brevipalpis TaxID=37001 RepID=A0A1A9WEK6_9MUSC